MPKHKKQPRNAFFFFMQDRKTDLEREGYQFPRGYADVSVAVQGQWERLDPAKRARYERLAKEAKEKDKNNLDNKFTATGESYSSVQQRMKADQDEKLKLDILFNKIVNVPNPGGRVYIVMKATAACEVDLPVGPQGRCGEKEFYPLEIALAAFNLKDGFICSYWTLVDTKTVPCGYASATKETSDDTLLPQPGGKFFQDKYQQGKDYDTIITKIRKFITVWGAGYPDNKIMIFGMAPDLPVNKGCLDWLVKHSQVDERINQDFFDELKYYPLPELMVQLSVLANRLDPTYMDEIVQFQLPGTAEAILKHGCYDYREEITCKYHRLDETSQKMHLCCQNIILRRIFLMLERLILVFNYDRTDRHGVSTFSKAPLPDHLREIVDKAQEKERQS